MRRPAREPSAAVPTSDVRPFVFGVNSVTDPGMRGASSTGASTPLPWVCSTMTGRFELQLRSSSATRMKFALATSGSSFPSLTRRARTTAGPSRASGSWYRGEFMPGTLPSSV